MFVSTILLAVAPAALPQAGPSLTDPMTTDRRSAPTLMVLKTGSWDTDQGLPPMPDYLSYNNAEAQSAGYYFVQGQPQGMGALRERMEAAGGSVFDYVPHNAFEAQLSVDAVNALQAEGVRTFAIHPAFKMDPQLGLYKTSQQDAKGRMELVIEFWPNRDLFEEEGKVRDLEIEVLQLTDTGRYLRALVLADTMQAVVLAHMDSVRWIEENAPAAPRNDKSRWVVQTNIPNNIKLWQAGLLGDNVTIGHVDGRIQESSCFFDDPSGVPPGPSHRKIKWWSSPGGADSHGTHTAGSAAGNSFDVNGSIYRIGMAPTAFLVSHSYFPGTNDFGVQLAEAYNNGARLHTNSWGNDWTTSYDGRCRDIDAHSHDRQDALVAFAVTNGSNLKNPENAKSCLAVGATDRGNPDNHGTGGKGPTADGRLKPEVYAPGCSTFSASTGSCGTVSMCGTSMACPVVVGCAALVKQYFEDGYYPSGGANATDAFVPSGSLVRAMVANSCVDMTGVSQYPSYTEGWGRVLLDNSIFLTGDGRNLWVQDILHSQGLSAGQTQTYTVNVNNGSNLRITLAFADEPGAVSAAQPVVNNLNLRVTAPNGTVYHGNLLNQNNNAESLANPTKTDPKNTMEMVNIANPASGNWTIEVIGADVPVGPQGYALVAAY